MVIFHIYFSAKDCFHPFSVSEEQNMAWSPVNVPGRTNKMQGDTWFPKSNGLTLHVYHNCKKPKHTVPIFKQNNKSTSIFKEQNPDVWWLIWTNEFPWLMFLNPVKDKAISCCCCLSDLYLHTMQHPPSYKLVYLHPINNIYILINNHVFMVR